MIPPLPWKVGDPYRRRFARTEPRNGVYTSPEFDDLPVGDCPHCAELGKPISTYECQNKPGRGRTIHVHFDNSFPDLSSATITAADGTIVARLHDDGPTTEQQIEIATAIVAAMNGEKR